MQEEAVELLANGVVNVMRHLAMIEDAEHVSRLQRSKHECRMTKQIQSKEDGPQRRGYSKNICGRHGRLYTFDEV